jgi:hypothetical protein
MLQGMRSTPLVATLLLQVQVVTAHMVPHPEPSIEGSLRLILARVQRALPLQQAQLSQLAPLPDLTGKSDLSQFAMRFRSAAIIPVISAVLQT